MAHAFNQSTWEAAAALGYLVYLVRLCLKNSKWYTINIPPIYTKQPIVLSQFIKTYLLLLSKLKPVYSLHRDFFYAWDSPCRGSSSRESDSRQFPYFDCQPWISLYQDWFYLKWTWNRLVLLSIFLWFKNFVMTLLFCYMAQGLNCKIHINLSCQPFKKYTIW